MIEYVVSADLLFQTCASGTLEDVQKLLEDEPYIAKATETEHRIRDPDIGHSRPILNLSLMCSKAAAAGSADIFEYLLSFSRKHGIAAEDLVSRDTINSAITSSNSVAIFRAMVAVKPSAVDEYLGHEHRPLSYAIAGGRNDAQYTSTRAQLVQFLLENGADPNRADNAFYSGPGVYLESAVQYASLEVVKLLLQHGAQIDQSGAMHRASELNRIDVMDLLLQHGADVNEQLKENNPMHSSKRRTRLRKETGIEPRTSINTEAKLRNESPLHFSVSFVRQKRRCGWWPTVRILGWRTHKAGVPKVWRS